MKTITARVIQVTDQDGTRDLIEPVEQIPPGLRVIFNGTEYQIAETKEEEAQLINDTPALKSFMEENDRLTKEKAEPQEEEK